MKAFIFARGGSKGIPMKNIAPFGSSNLLSNTICQLQSIERIKEIYVSTDSQDIARIAKRNNVKVVDRPGYLSSDVASEIDAWRHLCQHLAIPLSEPFLVAPVTSPLRSSVDIDNAFDLWDSGKYDIIMSRTLSHRNPYLNMVTSSTNGRLLPLPSSKPIYRRQDAPIFYDILTVLYLTTSKFLSSASDLMQGNVGWIDVPPERSIDIDTPFDLRIARLLHKGS